MTEKEETLKPVELVLTVKGTAPLLPQKFNEQFKKDWGFQLVDDGHARLIWTFPYDQELQAVWFRIAFGAVKTVFEEMGWTDLELSMSVEPLTRSRKGKGE